MPPPRVYCTGDIITAAIWNQDVVLNLAYQDDVDVAAKFADAIIKSTDGLTRFEKRAAIVNAGLAESYCTFCSSEWIADRRGNCGACGAPRKEARAYG